MHEPLRGTTADPSTWDQLIRKLAIRLGSEASAYVSVKINEAINHSLDNFLKRIEGEFTAKIARIEDHVNVMTRNYQKLADDSNIFAPTIKIASVAAQDTLAHLKAREGALVGSVLFLQASPRIEAHLRVVRESLESQGHRLRRLHRQMLALDRHLVFRAILWSSNNVREVVDRIATETDDISQNLNDMRDALVGIESELASLRITLKPVDGIEQSDRTVENEIPGEDHERSY